MALFSNSIKDQKGETLVEALLALAVATVIATGIVIAVTTALSGTAYNQNSNFAGNYAQEGSNLIKDKAAQNFTTFQNTYLYNSADTNQNIYYFGDDQKLSTTINDCSESSVAGYNLSDSSGNCSFVRTAYINTNGCDQRKLGSTCPDSSGKKACPAGIFVASMVSWTDSKCRINNINCHKVEIDSCLTNLNVLPAP